MPSCSSIANIIDHEDMPGRIHHFDSSQLQATSKFVDYEYAPKMVLLPATSELRKPLLGRIWCDTAAGHFERRFTPYRIRFGDTVARTVDHPLLAKERFLFDRERMYLDTSIHIQRAGKSAMPEITREYSEAIRASVNDRVDRRFCHDVVLISHHEGGHTWGHYLVQSIPRMLLFLNAFPEGKIAVPMWHANGANGFGEALALYNIPRERLAPLDISVVYRFKQAILLDFLFNFEFTAPHPKVVPLLRRPTRRVHTPKRKRGAFIKRRLAEKRLIYNARDVDQVMARHGIDVYGPDELALRAQVDLWRTHELVITTLGSDLANMVYAQPGTRVLVLSPHWFGDDFFFELSVTAGVRWHELRCGEMALRDEEQPHNSSFNVDTDLLDSVLATLMT
jgi:hypothetical protein